MKGRSKKYLLGISLLCVLVLGGLFAKTIEPKATDTPTSIGPLSSLVVTPDILTYSQGAAAIVIGTVKEVVDHPNQTGTPYTQPILDAQVQVDEVLKGDPNMQSVPVMMIGTSENVQMEDNVTLKQGEHVLLFLGTDGEGNYVVFAEDAGKCLIDKDGNVTGAPVFTMPLAVLENKIREALGNTVQ